MATRTRKPNTKPAPKPETPVEEPVAEETPAETPEADDTPADETPALAIGAVLDELPGVAARSYTKGNKWTKPLTDLATNNAGKWVVIDILTGENDTDRNRKAQGRANQVNQGLKRDRIPVPGLDKSLFQVKAREGVVYASYPIVEIEDEDAGEEGAAE